jgi:DNA helicase TIP49 (TBP-interacting protein)
MEIDMKKFVQYLDNHKNSHIQTQDYWQLIHNINMNYQQHHIGPSIIPYYPTTYDKWQIDHEINIIPDISKPVDTIIETNVDTIDDLLKIIKENPFDKDKTYNIDLQSLHKIHIELKEIQNMIGLSKLKQAVVDQLLYFIQNLHIGGKECDFKHTVLAGPPGTGKTEIARLMGTMYSKIGVLKNNVFKKVTRSDLIAGYLGQTALKTQKVIDSCLGGVLFIDEAYSLGDSSDSFSRECVDTLCEALSSHKGELMVIIAGYENELNESFFKMNTGLPSRFLWRFSMDAYSAKEMHDIFMKKVIDNDWTIVDIPISWFEKRKDKFTHYGRDMEILFTYTKIAHGRRIYGKNIDNRKKISIEDLDKGYNTFLENKGSKKGTSVIHSMYM